MSQRRKLVSMLYIFLISALMIQTVVADVEPNNNFGQAESIQQGISEGSLGPEDTVDMYVYESSGEADIRVDVHPDYTFLLSVKVYDRDQSVVTEGASANQGDLVTLDVLNTVAGAYYIEVNAVTNMTGSYSIEVREVVSLSTLKIHVVDEQGNPVESANVRSTVQPADQPSLSGMTEGDGRIIFPGISYGNYTFEVSKTGYQTVSIGESFESNVKVEVTVTLSVNPDVPLNPVPSGIPGYAYFLLGVGVFGVGWYLLRRWIGDRIFQQKTEEYDPSNV